MDVTEAALETSSRCNLIRYPLIVSLMILRSSGVRKSAKTSLILVVESTMSLCNLVVGATAGYSHMDNLSSLLKTSSVD